MAAFLLLLGHSWALCLLEACFSVTRCNTKHGCLSASGCRFATSLLYYGLSLNVGSFGINIYVTQFIFGAVEIPASMVSLFLNQRLGRRLTQSSLLIFGGAACLLTLAVPQGRLDTAYAGMQGRTLAAKKKKRVKTRFAHWCCKCASEYQLLMFKLKLNVLYIVNLNIFLYLLLVGWI